MKIKELLTALPNTTSLNFGRALLQELGSMDLDKNQDISAEIIQKLIAHCRYLEVQSGKNPMEAGIGAHFPVEHSQRNNFQFEQDKRMILNHLTTVLQSLSV